MEVLRSKRVREISAARSQRYDLRRHVSLDEYAGIDLEKPENSFRIFNISRYHDVAKCTRSRSIASAKGSCHRPFR